MVLLVVRARGDEDASGAAVDGVEGLFRILYCTVGVPPRGTCTEVPPYLRSGITSTSVL